MKYILLIIALGVSNLTTWAWGNQGHQIIGALAFSRIDQPVKDSVTKYLGDLSLENAGLWMDEMRKNHDFDYMKPWHFIAFDKGQEYQPSTAENVVNELNKVIAELKQRKQLTKEQINFDLKVLVHLIEDLQMPLHAGYESDKEGNNVKVQFQGKETSLHWLWDNDMIVDRKIDLKTVQTAVDKLKPTEVSTIANVDVVAWMKESRSYLPQVYNYTGNTIEAAYVDSNITIVTNRLAYGSIRLAQILIEIFK